jgi:enoyl reductase-like protein
VECQLSALKECINLFEIRQALAELPETLDDTYARILEKIPKRYRKVAHSALQLLAVSYRPLTVEEVAEATAVDYENEKFDPVLQRPRDPFYILKVCSGLVMARPNTYVPSLCDRCNF